MRRDRSIACLAAVAVLTAAGPAPAADTQATADRAAAKVLERVRTASCEELRAGWKKPRTGLKAQAYRQVGQRLREDAALRAAVLAKVAVPVADKLIVCGLIP
jgi:hypothetical protein